MTTRFSAVAPAAYVAHRLSAIDFHLDRLAKGRDPYGHLLAIERLARAARAEWTAVEAMRAGPPAGDSAKPAPSSDPLISELARLVEALDERYPDGPSELTESDLANAADMPNMPIVSDAERSPAA
jgi:hypothetical protein